ncbi:MAG: SoxY-related AACIE arm protein [Thalassobaculales bacterium]
MDRAPEHPQGRQRPPGPSRRAVIAGGAGLLAVAVVPSAGAEPPAMAAAIRAFTGGAVPQPGGVAIDISPLVENGNAVPVVVSADSPMTAASHVRALALFNEKNPQPNVAVFHFGPQAGRARVATRMRLATSQRVVAVAAFSDGSFRSAGADVIVTLAACVEG